MTETIKLPNYCEPDWENARYGSLEELKETVSYLTVKIQKKIEFDNECKCLVDYSELEKAILWYQKKPSFRNRIYKNPELLEVK